VNELHKSSITVKNFQENWNKVRRKAKNEIVAPGAYESTHLNYEMIIAHLMIGCKAATRCVE